MAEVYKLPGSSYEELTKIVRAYATSKNGVAVTLAELAQASGIDRTIISRNNGFLVQIKLISDGNKKSATELCINLGRSYQLNMNEKIVDIWSEIIRNDDFLNRMISTIQIKGEMTKSEFVNHIVYSSGNNNSNNARAGASAIIEILKLTQLIEEQDGKIVVGSGSVRKSEISEITLNDAEAQAIGTKKMEISLKEIQNPEVGYYIQAYTCESGKVAKFIIPEDATEDDLFAFADMLNIVLKRKFKIRDTE